MAVEIRILLGHRKMRLLVVHQMALVVVRMGKRMLEVLQLLVVLMVLVALQMIENLMNQKVLVALHLELSLVLQTALISRRSIGRKMMGLQKELEALTALVVVLMDGRMLVVHHLMAVRMEEHPMHQILMVVLMVLQFLRRMKNQMELEMVVVV